MDIAIKNCKKCPNYIGDNGESYCKLNLNVCIEQTVDLKIEKITKPRWHTINSNADIDKLVEDFCNQFSSGVLTKYPLAIFKEWLKEEVEE